MEKDFFFGEGNSIMDFFIVRRKFFRKKIYYEKEFLLWNKGYYEKEIQQ